VKVAEMPLGKDPADIILKDPSEFKQIVGKSVHVIEFLLHVLTREESDERSLKRRTRTEILPFLLLLPDRIDQEHFIGVVAQAIHSTTDAVRFEVDRLRDETKAGPLPHHELNDAVLKEAVEKPDMVRSARIFLEAAADVIEPTLAVFVKSEVTRLLADDGETELIPESELARVTFTLEQDFAKMPELAVKEDIVSRLNIFRTALIRRALAEQRRILKEAEEIGDDKQLLASLEAIKQSETKLKLPAYTIDDLKGER
jgi:DNA primase